MGLRINLHTARTTVGHNVELNGRYHHLNRKLYKEWIYTVHVL